jgi:hypothetical protein
MGLLQAAAGTDPTDPFFRPAFPQRVSSQAFRHVPRLAFVGAAPAKETVAVIEQDDEPTVARCRFVTKFARLRMVAVPNSPQILDEVTHTPTI